MGTVANKEKKGACAMYKIDFQKPIHIHFIGIGGISMSGLAEIPVSYTHLTLPTKLEV